MAETIAPEPRENPDLLGHAGAEALLLDAMRGGRMHHAWLITGPVGIGKATLAFRFARRLFQGPADTLHVPPEAPVFSRVAAGSHADLLTIERAMDPAGKRRRREIRVDEVRAAHGFLRLTPAEAGWRVVIVDEAEELNRNAANALLKLLEEPPPRALLLLACSAPGRLPATVRSRCRQLKLSALATAEVDGLLARYAPGLDAAERAHLAGLSRGSPGQALLLAEDDGVALAKQAATVLAAAPEAVAITGFQIGDQMQKPDAPYGPFMDQLRGQIDRAVRAAARDPGRAEAWMRGRPLADWARIWHALTALQEETERFHLDRRQAILSGFALLDQT